MGPTSSSVFLGVCNTRNLVADDPINMIAADKRMFPAGALEIICWLYHVDLNWHEWHFCKMDTAVHRLLAMSTWHGQPHTGHSSNSSHCQDFNTRNLSSLRCPTGSQIKLPRCSFDCAVGVGLSVMFPILTCGRPCPLLTWTSLENLVLGHGSDLSLTTSYFDAMHSECRHRLPPR